MHWTDERLIQVDPMCTLGDGPGGVRVWYGNYAEILRAPGGGMRWLPRCWTLEWASTHWRFQGDSLEWILQVVRDSVFAGRYNQGKRVDIPVSSGCSK